MKDARRMTGSESGVRHSIECDDRCDERSQKRDPRRTRPVRVLGVCLTTLVLLLSATAIVGCASSATTSAAEANVVAVAEHRFFVASRHANIAAKARCSKKSGQAGASCFHRVVELLE